jgi:hypothetical protein
MDLKFNSDGSIMLPEDVKKDIENKKSGIIITRKEISRNQPAIAHLIIEVGENISERELVMKGIYYYCKKYIYTIYPTVKKDIKFFDDKVIIEARESFMMYSFLERVLNKIKSTYKNIFTEGNFSKYG